MNILLTGFEPFGGEALNPSWELAQALDGQVLAGMTVHARRLPTCFGSAPGVLGQALASLDPALVVCLGQATGRAEISIERVAVNLIDARIPDNDGCQPHDQPIRSDGPAAYFSSLPLKPMVAGLRAAGYPAGLSLSAGAFVCNQVFYELMHRLEGRRVPAGFIHLPALPEQAARLPSGTPSMSLAHQIDAIRLALSLAAEPRSIETAAAQDEGAPIA